MCGPGKAYIRTLAYQICDRTARIRSLLSYQRSCPLYQMNPGGRSMGGTLTPTLAPTRSKRLLMLQETGALLSVVSTGRRSKRTTLSTQNPTARHLHLDSLMMHIRQCQSCILDPLTNWSEVPQVRLQLVEILTDPVTSSLRRRSTHTVTLS